MLEELVAEAVSEPELSLITGPCVRAAWERMRSSGGLRSDSWSPRELLCLPAEAAEAYANILNHVEQEMCGPPQTLVDKIIFLLKPSGDDRTIGLGSSLLTM